MNEKTENISLGGNIELKGFQNAEKAKLVVLKKIIGNYARQMKEKRTDYERLIVSFDEDSSSIKAELFAGGNSLGGGG